MHRLARSTDLDSIQLALHFLLLPNLHLLRFCAHSCVPSRVDRFFEMRISLLTAAAGYDEVEVVV